MSASAGVEARIDWLADATLGRVASDHDATVPLEPAREVRFRRVVVEVEEGDDRGKRATSSGEELTVGTAAGNDLVLTDGAVSRHHCAISVTPQRDAFRLRDLGSMNGTQLGGFRVESAYLKDGASIRVGRTKLRFRSLDEDIREPLSDDARFGPLLGKSAAMRRLFAVLPRIATADSTVLLEGETGTGKGLVALAMHEASPRAAGPFVVIDCASIPASLVEGELFGHLKGSFTGAEQSRAGAFEAAAGGTVFLDEIGELPIDLQPKLLRALEERKVKRIGGRDSIDLDVRVVAATNRDLRAEVNRGTFRADLFYRLAIVRLRVPSLRERRDDIEVLVRHFFEQFCPERPTPPAALVADLMRQELPGNVRELRSAVERAVLFEGAELETTFSGPPGHEPPPPPRFDPAVSFRAAKELLVERWERDYLSDLLSNAGGNVSKAARMARMDRNHLRELLRRHRL